MTSLIQEKRNANGTLDFWYVLPSEALRDLVYRKLREQYPELNYCCEWKDAGGFGLHLTVAEWKTKEGGGMYHAPHSRRHFMESSILNRPPFTDAEVRELGKRYGRLWRYMGFQFEQAANDGPYGNMDEGSLGGPYEGCNAERERGMRGNY